MAAWPAPASWPPRSPLPFGIAQGGSVLLDPSVLGLGLAMAVLASVVPYTLELRALRHLQRKTFSILVALEPAVGSLVGFLLLDQHLGPVSLLAIGLVVAAGVGATVTADARRRLRPRSEVADLAPDRRPDVTLDRRVRFRSRGKGAW